MTAWRAQQACGPGGGSALPSILFCAASSLRSSEFEGDRHCGQAADVPSETNPVDPQRCGKTELSSISPPFLGYRLKVEVEEIRTECHRADLEAGGVPSV